MIDSSFLDVKFTEITLIHILILIGIPYILFYFFERHTKFDKFPEKWEGALFVFISGGIITLLSLMLQRVMQISFWIFYLFFISILSLILYLIYLIKFNKRADKEKWVLIKFKNEERFEGIISDFNDHFIELRGGKSDKIVRLDTTGNEKEVDWENIQFNLSEVFGIYSL